MEAGVSPFSFDADPMPQCNCMLVLPEPFGVSVLAARACLFNRSIRLLFIAKRCSTIELG